MGGEFGTALMLLVIGMITVITVLSLVVLLGNVLIRSVNALQKDLPQTNAQDIPSLPSAKMAAIAAAVEHATHGKGKITSVEKI